MMKFINGMTNHFRGRLIALYLFRAALFVTQYLFFHPEKFRRESVKRILIVRLTHLGDLLLSLPTINSLNISFPEAKITLVAGEWNKELAEEFGYLFDEIRLYNVPKYCRRPEQKQSLAQRLGIIKGLKNLNFDLCIDFDGSTGFLFLYLLKGIRYLASIEAIRFWQNMEQLGIAKNRFSYNIFRTHEIDNLACVLQLLNIENHSKSFALASSPDAEQFVDDFLQRNLSAPEKPIVGIHPSASDERRMWSPENFARVADYLAHSFGCTILLFGARSDSGWVSVIQRTMHEQSISCTEFSVPQFIAAVRKCALFICLDSFSQHVAFLHRVPMIVIFTGAFIVRCSPQGDPDKYAIVLRDEESQEISVADVINRIPKYFLNHTRSSQASKEIKDIKAIVPRPIFL
jgi:ADP-heptose:LPS heptosyltransferase